MMRAETSVVAIAFGAVGLLVGCGPAASQAFPSSTTGGGESGDATGLGTTGAAASTTGPSTASADAGTTTTGEAGDDTGPPPPPGFLNHPDVSESYTCSLYAENCPPGEKCVPIANDGGNSWNALACRPIVDDPDAPGEPCSITMGSGVDGYDTCEKHAMCWDVDPDTNLGKCVALCIGGEATPTCLKPDAVCSIGAEGALALCLPSCNPLLQDCAEAEGCYPGDNGFVCVPSAPQEGGGTLGATCEYTNACLPGLYCGLGGAFCPKGAARCCLPFCDVTAPDCPAPLECGLALEPGSAQAGLENVGVCWSE